MKYLIAALISALLLTSVCRTQSRQAGDRSNISAEEYAVYAAVIGDMFAGDKVTFDTQAKVKILVIQDRTVSNIIAENEGERLKQVGFASISQETIDDYLVNILLTVPQ
ncbi:MAG TPA: hypothetical protein VFV58_29805 [Blastocatellia bacterium]|jgi:hypothetical protein|nr:hypothetical protein [Blastocatellia bacterium]